MGCPRARRVSREGSLRRLAAGLFLAGVPALGPGCGGAQIREYSSLLPQEVRTADQDNQASPSPPIRPVAHTEQQAPAPAQKGDSSETLSHPRLLPPLSPVAQPLPAHSPKEVPITLDTVFRLAQQHNARIGLAREKLGASEAASADSVGHWLPKTYAGLAYYRHEGGIQNEDGTLQHSSFGALFPGMQIQSELDLREATFRQVDAERKRWQSKAELTQVNTEVLQEAATTYIDLLTARRGEALSRELEKLERQLLERAERTVQVEKGARILVDSVQASLANREHSAIRLRQQGNAASAKLAYLLGLPPDMHLVPVEIALVPIDLVDPSPSTDILVAQALTHGPGVRELEGLLATVEGGINKLSGLTNWLPTVQVNVFEGAFGAGPGASLNWDNRFDVAFQARWDVTRMLNAPRERMQAQSQLRQAQLNYEDLRGKLTAGVQEARDAIFSSRAEIRIAVNQLQSASETYRLSELRLKEKVQGSSINETQQTIRGLEQAHFNHLSSISNHNKAQVRLLLFLGEPNDHDKGH